MNLAILEGRLGRDPEVRVTQGGQKVCNFTMATSQKFTNKEGKKDEKVQWHRVTCWGTLAERAGQFLAKGRRILLEGRIEYSEYTDKENVKRYSTTVVANRVTFLDSPSKGATKGQEPIVVDDEQAMEEVEDSSIPANIGEPDAF
jgi:single-strand DNA-binding protein